MLMADYATKFEDLSRSVLTVIVRTLMGSKYVKFESSTRLEIKNFILIMRFFIFSADDQV